MTMPCSRRDFLAASATAAGAMALRPDRLFAAADAAGDKPVDMTIARWAAGQDLTAAQIKEAAIKLTEKAIEGLGGLKRFVKKGDVVWVKPNIAWDRKPELAGCTNPDVVATIVRLCLEAGAKTVKVGDNPVHKGQQTYVSSGIAAAAREAGATVVMLDQSRFRETAIQGEKVKTLALCPEIIEADLVINVPLPKHHSIAEVTVCMKNYMGVMSSRGAFHQAMPVCLADLTRFMKPRLCILDAVRVLTAHGPGGGDPKDVQLKLTVAAGVDIVALDALGAELLGRKPEKIATIVKAQEVGLGKMDYRSLALKELAVS